MDNSLKKKGFVLQSMVLQQQNSNSGNFLMTTLCYLCTWKLTLVGDMEWLHSPKKKKKESGMTLNLMNDVTLVFF